MQSQLTLSLLIITALLLNGCASNGANENNLDEPEPRPLIGDPELPYPPEKEPEVGDILHMPTGLYVTQQQMLDSIVDHRMVYVGETHDSPAAHRFQLDVLKAMFARHPDEVVLGMEVFVPGQQAVIDKWIAGELDEPSFLRQSQWFKVWRADFAYYRDLLTFARDNNIPVRALNIEKDLVRAVGSNPLDQLDEQQRQRLPDMRFVDEYQQAMVDAVFSGHGPGGKHAEGFKRVQMLWDQTMAENIVNYLQSPEGTGKRMMVVAGGHHVRYGYGIPRRVFNLMPSSYILAGTREIVIPEEKQHQIMDITLPRFPMTAYDFVKHVVYETLPQQGVKLGIMFGMVDGGLQINQIVPQSNAELAALQVSDIITHLDGVVMKDLYDIKYLLLEKRIGDTAEIELKRGDEVIKMTLQFEK